MKISNFDRVKTYISGFDELILGGFPKGSNILITGTPGTGKTIFSLEYLYNGIIKNNEVGIYFTFEEKKEALINQANQFGWDLEKLEKKGKLKIISIGSDDISKNTVHDLLEIINHTQAKRVIIDSITTLSFITPQIQGISTNQYVIKRFLYNFITSFKNIKDLTTIFISQKDEVASNITAEYLCDGVINIDYESLGGDYSRILTIKKMRQTRNNENLHPLEISKTGIVIHNIDE